MVGREISDLFPKPDVQLGDEVLRVEKLSRTGFYKDVSFSVRAGEIVGLTGLVGAGRTEVVESVCGITRPDSGKVYLEGKPVHIKKPIDAMKKGIILLPEDRQKQNADLTIIRRNAILQNSFLKKLIQRQLQFLTRHPHFPVVTSRK